MRGSKMSLMIRRQWYVILLLILVSLSVSAQDIPLFTSDFPAKEFKQRREAVYEAIGKDAIAVIQGAPKPVGFVRFRQSNEFYYLCGVETPHAYLVLNGLRHRTLLFLPHRSERHEVREGKGLTAEDKDLVLKLTGVDEVYGTDYLAEYLAQIAYRGKIETIFTSFFPQEGLATSRDVAHITLASIASDPWDGRPSREGQFIHLLRMRFPRYKIQDFSPILDKLRLIKSPREIALIRKATRLAGLAIMEAMRSTEPGLFEYEIAALAKFIFLRNGAQGDAFYALPATGPNIWYTHYHVGQRRLEDGDFFLLDYGPDVGYYMSDLTRNWPVNGKFNDWQRELYGFYIACYKAILKAIRPHETAAVIQLDAVKEMKRILSKTKFSKPIYEKAAKKFVSDYKRTAERGGSLGHWLGMATHDVGQRQDTTPLKPGMVFTIEPALRVPEEKFRIRIEDLIVITENGAEIVSDFVPREIEEIEKLMKEKGLLQKYLRAK